MFWLGMHCPVQSTGKIPLRCHRWSMEGAKDKAVNTRRWNCEVACCLAKRQFQLDAAGPILFWLSGALPGDAVGATLQS